MIFSYGFVEEAMTSAQHLFLGIDIPDDDPLKRAKLHISTAAPGVTIYEKDGQIQWQSDFVWLVCVNEEDGLDFRVLQTTDGNRELKVFWKEHELHDILKLRELLEASDSWELFSLRAVAIVQDRVEQQLRALENSVHLEHASASTNSSVRTHPYQLAMKLRKCEQNLLGRAYDELESRVRGPCHIPSNGLTLLNQQ